MKLLDLPGFSAASCAFIWTTVSGNSAATASRVVTTTTATNAFVCTNISPCIFQATWSGPDSRFAPRRREQPVVAITPHLDTILPVTRKNRGLDENESDIAHPCFPRPRCFAECHPIYC